MCTEYYFIYKPEDQWFNSQSLQVLQPSGSTIIFVQLFKQQFPQEINKVV